MCVCVCVDTGWVQRQQRVTVIHSCQFFFFFFSKAGQRQRPCQAETNVIEYESLFIGVSNITFCFWRIDINEVKVEMSQLELPTAGETNKFAL